MPFSAALWKKGEGGTGEAIPGFGPSPYPPARCDATRSRRRWRRRAWAIMASTAPRVAAGSSSQASATRSSCAAAGPEFGLQGEKVRFSAGICEVFASCRG